MGCTSSKGDRRNSAAAILEEHRVNNLINETNKADHHKVNQEIKLLLLGAGESGKSAIFKQIRCLHGAKLTREELIFWKQVIESNIIELMKVICDSLENLGLEDKITRPADVEVVKGADMRWHLSHPVAGSAGSNETIGQVIRRLWMFDRAVFHAWESRSKLQVVDSHEKFMDDIDRIMNPQYVPTVDDTVLGRIRTSGITSESFEIDHRKFTLYDVGGQRNERRKWIHAFDNVTACIFVAALSEYDQRCFEDNEKNRMVEAIELFSWIASHSSFVNTPLIIFLNKSDLLKQKLPRHPIGPPMWKDYRGGSDADKAANYFLKYFIEAARKSNPDREVYHHVTCATEAGNVNYVFQSCRSTVLQANLKSTGLI